MRLANKVAIVTGASSGIGMAIAKRFSSEGAAVVLSGRRVSALQSVLEEIQASGGRGVVADGDVRDGEYLEELVHLAEDRFGGLDLAVNNAGILGELGPIDEMSPAAWDEVISVNLTSAFLGARVQVPALRRRGGGSVLFTSSVVSHLIGLPGMVAYGASKAGLVGLVRSLATEVGGEGIRVNAILPGGIATPMGESFTADPDVFEMVKGFHALKRLGTPEEVAAAALFLASDEGSFVTGSALVVDGGNSINKT